MGKAQQSTEKPTESQTPTSHGGNHVVIVEPNPTQTSQTTYSIKAKSCDLHPPMRNLEFKASPAAEKPMYASTHEHISTPEVQRLVVEHIVKGNEIQILSN